MDSLIVAAGRALAAGDLIGALKRVALREDPPALALRGIAMAQLGEFERARALLSAAARAFGPAEAVAQARCVVAEAEIALVTRDLDLGAAALRRALATLEAGGDRLNAAHARHLVGRHLVLVGRLDEAEATLAGLDADPLPPAWRAIHHLVLAAVAIRRLRTGQARAALTLARAAAAEAPFPALRAEVEAAERRLDAPAARLRLDGETRPVTLDAVEAVLAGGRVMVDACRLTIRRGPEVRALATRPVLFALLRRLAEAWPGAVARGSLVAAAFRGREADESHRARLRVEIGRLRVEIAPFGTVVASRDGYGLEVGPEGLALLAPPTDHVDDALGALLDDGEAWSSAALAEALGTSRRTVQRGLDTLVRAGKARTVAAGRSRRWVTAGPVGSATPLLLPGPLPSPA